MIYSTRDEVRAEVVASIEASGESAADFDVDAIADQAFGDYVQGYARSVTVDDFWQIVEANAR